MDARITGVNPITTEILRNAFNSIAEDMNAALIRSAYSPLIYEGKDCAVALLDADGEVLGQSLGIPLFLGNLSLCVQTTAEMKGWDYFQEGDVVFLNDAYIGGTHLNDVTRYAADLLARTQGRLCLFASALDGRWRKGYEPVNRLHRDLSGRHALGANESLCCGAFPRQKSSISFGVTAASAQF